MHRCASYPAPDCLVQLDVHSYVRGPHVLSSKLFDLFDSLRSPIFEGNFVQPFVKVNGILPCDSILHTAFLVHHLRTNFWIEGMQISNVDKSLAAIAAPGTAFTRPCSEIVYLA